ncbi:MAG: DUF6941 family protein [Planctomycetota bacterium]|jgi:hypothetical protein
MPGHKPPPEVLALLICDQIITDRMSGKQSLIGMFSTIHARRYPASHPQLSVYVMLSGGHGVTDFTIRIVDANEDRPPIVEGRGRVDFKDPRAIANLALQFHGLSFPLAGSYRVQLYAGTVLLREARLELRQITTKPKKENGGGGEPDADE